MNITQATCVTAPIILIHGGEGRGKTTLLSKFKNSAALLLERGVPAGVKLDAIDGLGAYGAVIDTFKQLYQDARGYQCLGIDTLDALETMLLEHVCVEHGWPNIEKPPYHNMTIVMVAHSEITRIDDPRAPSFTQYAPRLHKRARALVQDACDAVFFLAEDLKISTDDSGFRERVRARQGLCDCRPTVAALPSRHHRIA